MVWAQFVLSMLKSTFLSTTSYRHARDGDSTKPTPDMLTPSLAAQPSPPMLKSIFGAPTALMQTPSCSTQPQQPCQQHPWGTTAMPTTPLGHYSHADTIYLNTTRKTDMLTPHFGAQPTTSTLQPSFLTQHNSHGDTTFLATTNYRHAFAQKDICPEDICPEGRLLRKTFAQKDICPERQLTRRTFAQKDDCPERHFPSETFAQKDNCSDNI
jgi:hypothetical protein